MAPIVWHLVCKRMPALRVMQSAYVCTVQVELPPLVPPSLGAAAAASDGGASGSEGERAVRGDRGTPAGAWLPLANPGGMLEGAAAASAPSEGPARGTGGDRAEGDGSAERVRQRRDRAEEKRRRFGAETAARIGNGYVAAKMLRARLLHHAILRLLGAPLTLQAI